MIGYLTQQPTSFLEYGFLIVVVIVFSLGYVYTSAILVRQGSLSDTSDVDKLRFSSAFFSYLGYAALEEVIFRFLPLFLAVRSFGFTWMVLVVALFSSLIFGLIHKYSFLIDFRPVTDKPEFEVSFSLKDLGLAPLYVYLIVHGGVGLIFSFCYLKAGGSSLTGSIQALAVCTIAHTLLNMSLWGLRKLSTPSIQAGSS